MCQKQLILLQVKLLKCLVDNIVVDISFNQLGGLFTLNFLEEMDMQIENNHLFKRSIILVSKMPPSPLYLPFPPAPIVYFQTSFR